MLKQLRSTSIVPDIEDEPIEDCTVVSASYRLKYFLPYFALDRFHAHLTIFKATIQKSIINNVAVSKMTMLRLPLHVAPKFNIGTNQQQELKLTECPADKLESCLTLPTSETECCWGLNSKKEHQRKTWTTVESQIPKETKVTTPSRTLEGKRRVTFERQVEINFTLTRQEISPQEREEMWYSSDEYNNITRKCIKQISILENGNRLNDQRNNSFRGLENSTRLQLLSKGMNRCLAYEAVFGEQERQDRAGVVTYDADEIARVYCSTSHSSQLWAHVVGVADQREAQEIHDDSEE